MLTTFFLLCLFLGGMMLPSPSLVVSILLPSMLAAWLTSQLCRQRFAEVLAKQRYVQEHELQRRANAFKDRFLLHVNHELRTPLTEVYCYLDLLKSHYGQLDSDTQQVFIQEALDGCEELVHLTNQILQALQLEHEEYTPHAEHGSVAGIIADALAHIRSRDHVTHAVRVDAAEPLRVWADPNLVSQVLQDLLSNAFKYAPHQTTVVISARLEMSDYPSVRFCVQDSGPGIPPSEQPLLFHKFVRLQRDIAGRVRGIGLGLYISRHLVSAMGGRIWIESAGISGEGTRLCFTLPAVAP
ncbi:MAG TPA: HAMP domain-containing sensor histidine kinase [Ktedonobacteraceae bacterium]|nr:HAMP domain-containing sensor histidine kinase [Ktedonobacteraceae bacterium]